MPNLQSLFPVYLPKKQKDEDDERYETNITENENNLNQNLNILFEAVQQLMDKQEKG